MTHPMNCLRPLSWLKAGPAARPTPTLVRAYVETGDERCPLAGVWSCRTEAAPVPEEPASRVPAVWRSLSRRAIHRSLIGAA